MLAAAVLCGCGKADDSADKKALPVTLHVEDADGSPAAGVTVTVMKAAESDHQPNIARGEITTARLHGKAARKEPIPSFLKKTEYRKPGVFP